MVSTQDTRLIRSKANRNPVHHLPNLFIVNVNKKGLDLYQLVLLLDSNYMTIVYYLIIWIHLLFHSVFYGSSPMNITFSASNLHIFTSNNYEEFKNLPTIPLPLPIPNWPSPSSHNVPLQPSPSIPHNCLVRYHACTRIMNNLPQIACTKSWQTWPHSCTQMQKQ